MGKKYLDTKKGSLEQSVLGVWQTAIEEGETRVDGRTKQYKEHRKKLESARLRREKKKQVTEASGDKEAYQKFFNATLKKFGVKSPAELKDKDKKKFYDMIDAGWEGDNEKKEEVELDEFTKKDYDSNEDQNMHTENAIELARKFGSKKEYDQMVAIYKAHRKKGEISRSDQMKRDALVKKYLPKLKEEVDLDEGKMSQLHQLIKDKKSAEEIAKIMKVDVKTIKKLMAGYNESYEIGTDGYRKHTENVTPGEDGEWVAAQKSKNDSMREALAKVWGVDEGKSPFKKESKKDLTKEVKDGKTMTGKKIASVDINPKIMEKKK
jgi:hypothetical protein